MLSILLRVKFRLCRQYSAKPKKYAGRGDKTHRAAMTFRPIFISAVAEALGKAIPRPENDAEIVERHSGPALAESGGHQQGQRGALLTAPSDSAPAALLLSGSRPAPFTGYAAGSSPRGRTVCLFHSAPAVMVQDARSAHS